MRVPEVRAEEPYGGHVTTLPQPCVRCQKTTAEPVKVGVVHGNSGPGRDVYACRTCAPSVPVENDGDALAFLEAAQQRPDDHATR